MVEQQPKENPGLYQLWRQDDHGNRFLMSDFSELEEANRVRKVFEDRGHNQMYEVIPANPQITEDDTPNLTE